MGLYIHGKTVNKDDWTFSYSRLHYTVRYLALKYCGMPDNIGAKYNGEEKDSMAFYMNYYIHNNDVIDDEKMGQFIQAVQFSGKYFPNIMLHSDCEGNYTKNGKCDPINKGWRNGNSKQLLKELKILLEDEDLKEMQDKHIINALKHVRIFYNIVKGELEEGTGHIIFG